MTAPSPFRALRLRAGLYRLVRAFFAEIDARTFNLDPARPGYKHPKYGDASKAGPAYLQGAVVVIDPTSGDVRALVGGRNYAASPFDRVFALRQPGSAIKPLVYAAALSDSVPPNAIVPDTALSIPMPSGPNYQPGNADGQFLGPMPGELARPA